LGPAGRFALHYVQMLIAMVVGMGVLYPIWMMATAKLNGSALTGPEVESLVMATTMAAGMAFWMRFRRHRWRPVVEMSLAMYAGFVVLFPAYWAGLIGGDTVLSLGHVFMLGFMLIAMLLRRAEYSEHHHRP
jgi:hypothetical protein